MIERAIRLIDVVVSNKLYIESSGSQALVLHENARLEALLACSCGFMVEGRRISHTNPSINDIGKSRDPVLQSSLPTLHKPCSVWT
jgi:hypothetical protein